MFSTEYISTVFRVHTVATESILVKQDM